MGILFLILAILISGCGFLKPAVTPDPTPTPTITATPTATIVWFPATPTATPIPNITPTPQATPGSQREGISTLLIEDDFSDESLWQTYQSSSGNVAFGSEALTLAVSQEDTFLTSISRHTLPENFYLEISMQISLCQPRDQIGILFLYANDADYYRLLMTCNGQYRLELIQGMQSVVIQDWDTASQMSLNMPASNRISIWVYDGRLQFFINDVFQFEQKIAQNRAGGLGLFARTIQGSAMTIRFSDLQIYQVKLAE
jgi:hypothetical protein